MRSSVADHASAAHRELPEISGRMAKADLRKAEMPEFRVQVGRAIQRAISLVGWSLKELSGQVKRDERQLARWMNGAERPHFDALFAVEELRQPLVVALAELAGDQVVIETVVRVRRRAS